MIINFFALSKIDRTRGHGMKLSKKFCRIDARKYYFSQRVVDGWNKLPQEVVNADTVNTFKNRLDKFGNYG